MRNHNRILLATVVACVAIITVTAALAQDFTTQSTALSTPQVNGVIKFDISRPLRDMATEVPSTAGFHEASPVKYPHLAELQAMKNNPPAADGALQSSPGPLVSATLGLNLLGVGNGFPGYSVPDAPPDVNLAVGDTQVVQWVNVSYAVFDKTTGAVVAGPILGNAFWSGFGGGCQNTNSGDPVMLWDKIAHRWLAVQNVFSSPYATCIAVSTTADATGTYFRFQFQQPGFPDYPKWGVWPDGYYQAQNNFGATGSSFTGSYVCAYERAKLLAGDSSAKQICFQASSADDGLLPSDLDSPNTLPPSGEPNVFLGSIDAGTVYKYLFHADFTTPANSTFTGSGRTMPISGVSAYSLACGGFSACIQQRGVTDLLDSLGDRLMYRLAYRNFSDHQTWLVSHSVTAGSSTGQRWYEFHAPETSTTLSVYQQGTFAPDSSYRWMGSLAMDSAQDIAMGYSVSSSTLFPSISYTGRVVGDALGTMESEASIVSGTGSQSDTSNRWGDYTSMQIDASDDCTFWYTAEYYTVTASFDWSTRLATIKFPNCGGPPPADFSITASPTSVTVAAGSQGTSTITTTALNGFNSAITLSASGMPSGVGVSFSPNPIAAPGTGTSTMTITVASTTAAGNYPLTVTGAGGTTQHTATVTLTVTNTSTFTISASPSSLTIGRGNNGTSTITTTAMGSFNSSIALTISGLPSGTTASFSPSTIPAPGTGTSTLTINVGSNTRTGTYTLTVKGNGGGVQKTTTISLTVTAPDFTLSASPTSETISRGSAATYTVTLGAQGGFSGTVSLSASGCPSHSTCSFSPSSVTPPGTSTFTVQTTSQTTVKSYSITIKGTSGSLSHSQSVSLTVTR
jgi:hypothetical protein